MGRVLGCAGLYFLITGIGEMNWAKIGGGLLLLVWAGG